VSANGYEGAILWDLDGTLLSTAKAGRIALRASILELTGREADYGNLPTSGLTDTEVAAIALEAVGVEPNDELLLRVREGYERRLPEALLQREGGVLPGIADALAELETRGRVVSLLLTGNTPNGARIKLERYGLEAHFPHGGGFCEGHGGRVPIARRAFELANELVPGLTSDRTLVVGDTPKDVECATALGIRCLGLTTGHHTEEQLAAAGAWRILDRAPDALTLERFVLAGG
jgi:phosphoglycolate phosphatase-like HAD superfamily hydrolase